MPELVAVRTEEGDICTACLLYGTMFLIVKCTSGGLHLKVLVFFINLWNFGKISIFLASSGSFNVKKDNIHSIFFRCFGCKFWICRLRSKTKIHRLDRFHGKGPYYKILTEKKNNQSAGIWGWVCHIIIFTIIKTLFSFLLFCMRLCLLGRKYKLDNINQR